MILSKKLIPLLISTLVIILFSFKLSELKPFTGDELGTLEIQKVKKPIPYNKIVSAIIDLLSPVDADNIFYLRISSLIFTLLAVFIWYLNYFKSNVPINIFLGLFITNSFLIDQSIFFRYYSYYFLTSSITLFLIINYFKDLSINSKLLFSIFGFLVSPYIFHILNGLQFATYFIYIFIFHKIKSIRNRVLIMFLLSVAMIIIAFKPVYLWMLFNWINILDALFVDLDVQNLRGLSLGILIKPIYAVFQMTFGPVIAPTDSIFIFLYMSLYFFILLFLVLNIYKEDRENFYNYIVIGVIPFLVIYLFLQAISFPGFTQLEPKHGILLLPVLFAIF